MSTKWRGLSRELPDFHPETGHLHACNQQRSCGCASALYAVAEDLAGKAVWTEQVPPMVEQVREALHGDSDHAIEACRILMRHAALCAVDPHACVTCSAIVEATNV